MKLLPIILAVFAIPSYADDWTGTDKNKHFVAGAVIASVTTVATRSEGIGFLAGTAAGLAKEIYDGRRASTKDFIVTAAGAYVGAKIANVIITPNSISYSISF